MVHHVASQLAAVQSAQEQLNAVRRLQAQAEQRIQLGRQLFKAAEAHLASQQNLLAQVRSEQEALAQAIQADVARSLRQYDQWMGQQQQDVEGRLREMERRLAEMIEQWLSTEKRVDSFVRRAEALLDQGRYLLSGSSLAKPNESEPLPGGALGTKPGQDIYSGLVKSLPRN